MKPLIKYNVKIYGNNWKLITIILELKRTDFIDRIVKRAIDKIRSSLIISLKYMNNWYANTHLKMLITTFINSSDLYYSISFPLRSVCKNEYHSRKSIESGDGEGMEWRGKRSEWGRGKGLGNMWRKSEQWITTTDSCAQSEAWKGGISWIH